MQATPAAAIGNDSSQPSPLQTLGRILRGDIGFFIASIERSLMRAREHVQRTDDKTNERLSHDVSVIAGVALAMMSLKLLKVLPGLPFLPGWKTLFFYPLYILAAQLTYTRWGGTTAGTIIGVLGYIQGDGRYGAFEILKHIAPGLVIDLTWPIVRRLPRWTILYCGLGCIAAVARTFTEFLIMLLTQARLEAYAFTLGALLSNLVAGTLSGLVTYFLLPAFQRPSAEEPQPSPTTQPPPRATPATGHATEGSALESGALQDSSYTHPSSRIPPTPAN